MSKLIGALALLVLVSGTATGAKAAAWCAYYDASTRNCGFHTFEQCRAAISGVGGYCSPNYSQGNYTQGSSSRRRTRGY